MPKCAIKCETCHYENIFLLTLSIFYMKTEIKINQTITISVEMNRHFSYKSKDSEAGGNRQLTLSGCILFSNDNSALQGMISLISLSNC